MPRRCPTVTSSTASTVPAGLPAPSTTWAACSSIRPDRKPLASLGAPDEAHVLAVGLLGRAQPEAPGVGSYVVLAHVTHREQDARQGGLIEDGEHVGLVLGGIGAPPQASRGPAA